MSDERLTFRLSDNHRWLIAGERRWPVAEVEVADAHFPLSRVTEDYWIASRRAVVMVESGWKLSVIWGHMTYSDNKNARQYAEQQDVIGFGADEFHEEPFMVEVGLLRRNGGLVGDPAGWVIVEEFNTLVDAIIQVPSDVEFQNDEWTALMGREMQFRPAPDG